MNRMLEKYNSEIKSAMQEEFGIKNPMAIPQITKVVISMGVGASIAEKKRMEAATKDLATLSGQRPVVCNAKKSVSNFKLRQDMPIGCMVTLRAKRMYDFLDRLVNLAIPRVRDFRGLNPSAFDGRGNYSMGVTDQSVFPEIDIDRVDYAQGMNITIVTTARNDEQGKRLLTLFGMPFRN
jgi:large subunit ribosomal protein L5